MDSPDPHLREAYTCFRDAEQPTRADVDTTWAALQRRIEAGETGPSLPAEEPAVDEVDDNAASATRARRWPRVAAAAIAVAAGIGLLAWLPPATLLSPIGTGRGYVETEFEAKAANDTGTARFQDEQPKDASPRQRSPDEPLSLPPLESAPPPAPLETEDMPQLAVAAQPGAMVQPKRKRRTRRPPPKAVPSVEATAMAEQATALQDARGMIRRDPATALRQIEAHRERYPDSPFEREREALALLASCALDRVSVAQPRIDAFVAKHPASPLAQRVREACEDPR